MLLNGKWNLYFAPYDEKRSVMPDTLHSSGYGLIPAQVPGNVELDLITAGLLPEDIFRGLNIRKTEKFETYDWWYEKTFTAPEKISAKEKATLCFRGVDCLAEYFLNGEKLGESDNMFIAHEFDVTNKLAYGKNNTIVVHISSVAAKLAGGDLELCSIRSEWGMPKFLTHIRKAPHMSGWDIMPRAMSAGLWRDVELRIEPIYGIKYVYVTPDRIEGGVTKIRLMYDSHLPFEYRLADLKIKITLKCGDSVIESVQLRKGGIGCTYLEIPDCKYWWPRGYGEQNMYDITVALYTLSGELIAEKSVRRGIRWVKLCRTDTVEPNGRFEFEINGKKVLALGANWVPMDPFHSRDKSRYAKALAMLDDLNCNIVRCWGGNVYEDHEFFDFCDSHGIMVWQDFAMACQYYPQTEEFFDKIRREAEWVITEYRDHPSIVLWAGDNEIDSMTANMGENPSKNIITREVLPRVAARLDPNREFLPSSPYISEKAYAADENEQGSRFYAEDHLWGPRNYYKSDFYKNAGAYFVSEIGYHGCPARESIERFLDPEYVEYYFGNPQWVFHSSDQFERPGRADIMKRQVENVFGNAPDNLDDFILASQICQAEANKFFIEHTRARMDRQGGLIWWNLVDGWPQFSDAVVDYYYNKKLAYEYIKRSQQNFIVMMDEMGPWDGLPVLCANNVYEPVCGRVRITNLETDEILFEKEFFAEPFKATKIGAINVKRSTKGMLKIEWELENGTKGKNHYLLGTPPLSLEDYKKWYSKL